MAWNVTIDYDVRPQFTFEDGSDPESLNGLIGGHAISDPSRLPTSATADGPEEISTDILSAGTLSPGHWGAVVSPNLKDAVEAIEPGVHEFFPITMKRQDGTTFPGEFYLLRVRRAFPCVLFLESKHRQIGAVGVEPDLGKPIYRCHTDGLVLSKPAIAGHHLFSTYVVAGGSCILSDALMAECVRRQVRGFQAYPAREIDKPWAPETEVPELMHWLDERPDRAEYSKRIFAGVRS
jgi:hypothetical protein